MCLMSVSSVLLLVYVHVVANGLPGFFGTNLHLVLPIPIPHLLSGAFTRETTVSSVCE